MKAFSIYCIDKPGSAEPRNAHKLAHLAHVEANIDRYLVAGPMKDADGNVTGSLIIVKADNEADARAFFEQDPYFVADFWESISILQYMGVAGDWVGGKTW